MKIVKQVERVVETIVDVICDSCHTSCDMDHNTNNPGAFEFAEFKIHWGYYSTKDTESHEIIMCEACYDKMLELMNIKPKITYYL